GPSCRCGSRMPLVYDFAPSLGGDVCATKGCPVRGRHREWRWGASLGAHPKTLTEKVLWNAYPLFFIAGHSIHVSWRDYLISQASHMIGAPMGEQRHDHCLCWTPWS